MKLASITKNVDAGVDAQNCIAEHATISFNKAQNQLFQ